MSKYGGGKHYNFQQHESTKLIKISGLVNV